MQSRQHLANTLSLAPYRLTSPALVTILVPPLTVQVFLLIFNVTGRMSKECIHGHVQVQSAVQLSKQLSKECVQVQLIT